MALDSQRWENIARGLCMVKEGLRVTGWAVRGTRVGCKMFFKTGWRCTGDQMWPRAKP